MEKIAIVEQERATQEFELFHEHTKFSPYNVGQRVRNIVRYLNDPVTIYSSSRNHRAFNNRPKISIPKVPGTSRTIGYCLKSRTSCREFSDSALTLETLGRVLYDSAGSTRVVKNEKTGAEFHTRSYPSGGGLYPVELYLVLRNVEGVEPCVAHYNGKSHELSILHEIDDELDVRRMLMLSETPLDNAPVVILQTSVTQRSSGKYGNRGYRFSLLEAGHCAQSIALSCACEGLGSIAWGSYFDDDVDRLIGCDGVYETVVHALLIGHPDVPVDSPGALEDFSLQQLLLSDLEKTSRDSRHPPLIPEIAPKSTIAQCLKFLSTSKSHSVFWYSEALCIIAPEDTRVQAAKMLETLLSCNSLLGRLNERFGEITIVEIGSREHYCYSSSQCRAIAHVFISSDMLAEPVLAHELCHAFLTTGNRFLDEGLAVFVQNQLCGTDSISDICCQSSIGDYPWEQYRADLSTFGNQGTFLDGGSSEVYARALSLVDRLYTTLGESGLLDLLCQLRDNKSEPQKISLIEKAITMQSESTEPVLTELETPLDVETLIAKARITRSLPDNYRSTMNSYLEGDSPNDDFIAMRMLGTKIRVDTLNKEPYDEELDGIQEALYQRLSPYESPLVDVARAQINISKLFSLEGASARMLAMEYQQCLNNAVMADAPHPSALIDSALSDHYAQMRRDEPDLGECKKKLLAASRDTLYGEEADNYLKKFNLK